jgi:transcriptional regulator GlxA family with amidase domain
VQQRWPELNLDPEAIFVADGPLWTSAGITTGIDMMLAIVEADHGPEAARAIAQRLVLSVRRPGWQSQFSAMLGAQAGRQGRYADLVAWIAHNLHARLDVETLADRAGETLRSFHRNFTAATGKSPAAFVARQRIDHARSLIVQGLPLKQVADRTGYADVARLSTAFQRAFGMSANAYRIVHGAPPISPALRATPHRSHQPRP